MTPLDSLKTNNFEDFISCFANGCTECSLSEHEGNHPIIYRGNSKANILLLGEALGKIEQEKNNCWVGPAGQLLDKIFAAPDVELSTDRDMILSNILFCRPVANENSGKQNYTPKAEQIIKCWPFVQKLIEIINPKTIICCGLTSAKTVLSTPKAKMKDLEGNWFKYNKIPVFIMRHPSALLRLNQYPEEEKYMKLKVWEYMKKFSKKHKENQNGH
ncbi:MAG: uracil-DNA glycosylase [Halanaerobiales bacterium]|nr:uracil-DNA glycosylase [Halanaerobiales bacterium]